MLERCKTAFLISVTHLFTEASDAGDSDLCLRTPENSLSECHTYLNCKGLNLRSQ